MLGQYDWEITYKKVGPTRSFVTLCNIYNVMQPPQENHCNNVSLAFATCSSLI